MEKTQLNQKIQKPQFDINKVEGSCKKFKLNIIKNKYGNKEKTEYLFRLNILEKVIQICKSKDWLTKDDWKKHNIPMDDLIKNVFAATKNYLNIKKYYTFIDFEKQRKAYQN